MFHRIKVTKPVKSVVEKVELRTKIKMINKEE